MSNTVGFKAFVCSGRGAAALPAPEKKKKKLRAMLILELGIWVLPVTLFIAPCRRFTLLVAKLQELRRSMAAPRRAVPNLRSHLGRLPSLDILV